MKTCKQCGRSLNDAQFRNYYNGRKGTYTMCKDCESINSRFKYLSKKVNISAEEQQELNDIEALYKAREEVGLSTPTRQPNKRKDFLKEELAKYEITPQ